MLFMLQPSAHTADLEMTHIKPGRNIARERIVTIERDGTHDSMMMARRLARTDEDGSIDYVLNDGAGDLDVVDTLDQNVALCAEPSHESNLFQGAKHRASLLDDIGRHCSLFLQEVLQNNSHYRTRSVVLLVEGARGVSAGWPCPRLARLGACDVTKPSVIRAPLFEKPEHQFIAPSVISTAASAW